MAGLAATSPDMLETADSYFDSYFWYDIDVKSTLGFNENDVDCVASMHGIDILQCAKVMDLILDSGETSYTSRVYGFFDSNGNTMLNRVKLVSGRMPSSDSECVVQDSAGRYTEKAISIGDALMLSAENTNFENLRDNVSCEVLTVVGIVESPMSIAVMQEPTNVGSGTIGLDVYTMSSFFQTDYYTDLYLTLSGASQLDTFSRDYEELISAFVSRLETLGEERAALRSDEVRNEALSELDSLRSAANILKGLYSISDELSSDAIIRAGQTLESVKLITDSCDSDILVSLLTGTANSVNVSGTRDTSALLSKLETLISEYEEHLNGLSDGIWLIRTRSDAQGFSSYDSNVSKVSALAKIFPLFFFLVALLVALTTMTRLVEENRSQIGTLKALGFSNWQILVEYLLYSLLSSILGCVLGFIVGFRLFPYAVSSAYSMMYTLPDVVLPFRWSIVAWVAPVTVGSILLATFWACYDEFSSCPAVLMQPKAPASGKRIWLERFSFIWSRLSFTRKVTCRNLFRYKKRLFMTLLGVAGCTALLVTGFGLRDSIKDIVDKQFSELYIYELTIVTDGQTDDTLEIFLSDRSLIASSMGYHSEDGKVRFNGDSESVSLFTPDEPDRFNDFILLRDRRSGNAVPFSSTGVVLTEKLCETLGIKVGDTVTLEDSDGHRGDVRVDGITENYLTSFAYMSRETYHDAFGKEADCSTYMCCYSEGADVSSATSKALESVHVIYARSSTSLKDTFADSIHSINGVIWVLILAAGLLCGVVLFNLTNVNICERRKELATIRVLGFHEREVEAYIFRETNALSFLGSLIGLAAGVWLHSYVVRTVEVEQVMFGRNIYLLSFVLSILISMVFTLIVNEFMRHRIRKVDMVEAMKAND